MKGSKRGLVLGFGSILHVESKNKGGVENFGQKKEEEKRSTQSEQGWCWIAARQGPS